VDDDLLDRARQRVGQTLNDKYRIDALLGIGGMASVYRATHRNRAQLAVKVLHTELSRRAEVRTRFLREGYAANSVGHPGAVLVVDDDVTEDGTAFLVMELLDGIGVEEVGERFSTGGTPTDIAVAIVHQLLEVLEAAHAGGIVHRDIKPANLFVTRDGAVKVLDFGIARVLDPSGNALATDSGAPIGTPAFMAPEQALGHLEEIDARTDVWAAGATLFTLLAGRPVHVARTVGEVLVHAATQSAPPSSSVAAVPAPLAAVIDRALAFSREERWPTARAMADALSEAMPLPDRRVLSALVPPRSSVRHSQIEGLGSAPTLGSAPLVDPLASAPTLMAPGGETTLPVVSSPKGVRPARAGTWVWLASAAAVLSVAAAVGLVRRHRPVKVSVAAPSAEPASPPSPAGPPLVLITQVENETQDPMFDEVVDFMAETALNRSPDLYPFAGFPLRALISEWAPEATEKPELLGHIVAERTGRPVVVVRGKVDQEGSGYVVTLSATDGRGGAELFTGKRPAASAARLGTAVAGLACDLRAALHATPCDEISAVHTGASDSVEAVHEFVAGRAAHSAGRLTEAIPMLQRAVDLDPTFTRARSTLGLALWNTGRASEGQTQLDLALARREMLSERDAIQIDAAYFLVRDESSKVVADQEKLLVTWPLDTRMRSNLAATYYQQGLFRKALETGLLAAKEHPRLVVARSNLVCYSLAVGDAEQALNEARDVIAQFPHVPTYLRAFAAAASALLGRAEDVEAFRRELEGHAPSAGALLGADLALYEGRLRDAVAMLEAATKSTEAAKDPTEAEAVWAMLAEALLRQGNLVRAREAAMHVKGSPEMLVSFRVARVLAAAGKPEEARLIRERIASRPGERAPLLARLIDADVLLGRHSPLAAMDALGDIGTTAGSWLAHAERGVAAFEAGRLDDAERELGIAVQLRAVGAASFFDDTTTLRYLPPAYYFLARAKDGLHHRDAREAYSTFLALEPDAQGDPLVTDARRRREAIH
jgi:serine/threonine-protein kinase